MGWIAALLSQWQNPSCEWDVGRCGNPFTRFAQALKNRPNAEEVLVGLAETQEEIKDWCR
ncbi:MAG: hypothetical protein A3F14_00360 [Gammaproteobacteria bacterium RIFCSPHIGHO2_12_FULL_43_28]|nr:MAG: hypothetical protein A3F14_00360 [Gammaproteobacteria bacterium RIFCSPHIGHO2_12_FULL_43_28]